jgi:hypothetical protein
VILRGFLFTFLVLIGFQAPQAHALSGAFPASPKSSIFGSDETLKIQIEAPLKEIFKTHDPDKARPRVTGHITYVDAVKGNVTLPASFRVKGYSTVMLCSFKKLELKFKKKDTLGTIFEGIRSVDLNTHCDSSQGAVSPLVNIHREAVLYQMAKVLGVPTYQARKALVKYRGTGLVEDRVEDPFQAVFVEDKSDLLRRLDAKEVKDFDAIGSETPEKTPNVLYQLEGVESHQQIDLEDMEIISLFNVMIQNWDWHYPSVTNRYSLWNLKMIQVSPGKWIPLIHDFNSAGAINPGGPGMDLSQDFGLVSTEASLRIKNMFESKKTELYQLIETLGADEEGRKQMKSALDLFFSQGF